MHKPSIKPTIWTIAGSDCSGGAGIQADLQTISSMGAHGASVITAITAQNHNEVPACQILEPPMILSQIKALLSAKALKPAAIKLGMLANEAVVMSIVNSMAQFSFPILIADPVLKASCGTTLLDEGGSRAYAKKLFPLLSLITPNISEAEYFSGLKIESSTDAERAAEYFLNSGVRAVLIKGGHFNTSSQVASDFFAEKKSDGSLIKAWLHSPRQKVHCRGTGCTLSSAIAAAAGFGFSILDAVIIGKSYVNQCLRKAQEVNTHATTLDHSPWQPRSLDMPTLTTNALESDAPSIFADKIPYPRCGPKKIGFYPIVPRAHWITPLAEIGTTTIQLRIKDLSGDDLDREVASAVATARFLNVRLFINDFWKLALKHKAYGIHLGQEDLNQVSTNDLRSIHASGLRLGLSTHCFQEVARARFFRPSYIAIGPIYPTTLKKMPFAPQGTSKLAMWRSLLDEELIAIGGITLEGAPAVQAAGADGISVVSDVLSAANPIERARAWVRSIA